MIRHATVNGKSLKNRPGNESRRQPPATNPSARRQASDLSSRLPEVPVELKTILYIILFVIYKQKNNLDSDDK
jgi:hypothetical protein